VDEIHEDFNKEFGTDLEFPLQPTGQSEKKKGGS